MKMIRDKTAKKSENEFFFSSLFQFFIHILTLLINSSAEISRCLYICMHCHYIILFFRKHWFAYVLVLYRLRAFRLGAMARMLLMAASVTMMRLLHLHVYPFHRCISRKFILSFSLSSYLFFLWFSIHRTHTTNRHKASPQPTLTVCVSSYSFFIHDNNNYGK